MGPHPPMPANQQNRVASPAPGQSQGASSHVPSPRPINATQTPTPMSTPGSTTAQGVTRLFNPHNRHIKEQLRHSDKIHSHLISLHTSRVNSQPLQWLTLKAVECITSTTKRRTCPSEKMRLRISMAQDTRLLFLKDHLHRWRYDGWEMRNDQ